MTEEQVKQFTKRQPAQYRRPEFYFRGGDSLREQEYLQEEYKKALSDFRIAQQRLRQTQEEVQDATDVLAEREGYTNALATYLERDTQAATTENRMKNQLRQLEREIASVEITLKEVKSHQNPAALAALQKEKAHYMIEIQRGNRTIATQDELRDEAIRQIAACSVNGRYREARNLEYIADKTTNKKTRLRKSVMSLKKEFDIIIPKTPAQDEYSRRCRSALTANIKSKIDLYRVQEIEASRKPKHEKHINDLLDQICELNDRMVDIGIPDDVVNVDEFRERVLNEDYSDDDIEDEEEPAPEPQNNEDEIENDTQEEPSHNDEKNDDNEEAKKSEEAESTEKDKSEANTTENDDDDKKSEKKDKSMSGDFEDDDNDEKKSTTKSSMSNDFDDDDDKKSKSTTNKSMSNDFDDDDEKKTTSGGGDDDDEKKTTSGGGDDDDEEKKSTENDDDDDKKTTSGRGDDDDDDDKKTTSGGGDDDDDDDMKKSESNLDDDDFED